jgi:endo-1,4-beta-xylanase
MKNIPELSRIMAINKNRIKSEAERNSYALRLICSTAFLLICFSLSAWHSTTSSAKELSLKIEFADSFLIGTALNKTQIMSDDSSSREFVSRHFNALTAENEMKWERIHPLPGHYSFEVTDRLVSYAKEHDMHLTGHALVWHQQTPDWVFEGAKGKPASRELLLQRMEMHIRSVVGRYKGVIPSWDVVNEALNENGSFRKSKWYRIIGKDFVQKAFEFAHKADPGAKLYYNDYNLFKPKKRAGVLMLIKRIKKAGIPVHGVGMQGHYGLDFPKNVEEIEDSIIEFSKVTPTVMVTELDLSVLPFPEEGSEGADVSIDLRLKAKYNPYSNGLPPDIEEAQRRRYIDVFKVLLRNKEKVSRVTFWGVNDGDSWRNNWPMKGRTDYPLLIDRNNKLKKAAFDIFQIKSGTKQPA